MAKISLKAYLREIENQIDRGLIEEAIAHCRHILSIFPKHVETYRLLGKAFLETQRYGDAADILQRVLSADPDDFMSNVGMSIIREDEGNLEQAILHMERAFEVQPSNQAIQEELRRLYGKRDGFAPPKIRLTRGALARMYFKGELYPQAIAELRAGLAEDPQRLDLQQLLAMSYARTGQRAEAAETCNSLLRKLPYCIAANEIMAEVLKGTERAETTQAYRHRLISLNPYYAHTSPNAPTPDKVPDQAVTIEKLDYKPGQAGLGGQPLWAASLGMKIQDDEPDREALPEWLSESGEEHEPAGESKATSPFNVAAEDTSPWEAEEEDSSFEAGSEDEIPDWLKAAGWGPSTGTFDESAVNLSDLPDEEPAGEEEIAAGQVPDWLKAMAPAGPEAEQAGELPDWLAGEGQPAGDEPGEQGEEEPSVTDQLPEWLKELEIDTEGEDGEALSPEELSQAETAPGWLSELAAEPAEDQAGEGEEALDETVPGWLHELSAETPDGESEPDLGETTPGLLHELEAIQPAADEAGEAGLDETLPSWLHDLSADTQDSEAAPDLGETVPGWLSGLSGEAQDDQDEAPSSPPFSTGAEGETDELPDWLLELETQAEAQGAADDLEDTQPTPAADLTPSAEVAEATPAFDEGEAVTPEAGLEEMPEWLRETEAGPEQVTESEAVQDEIPAWLKDFEAEPEAGLDAGEEISSIEEEIELAETPDWLSEAAAEEGAEELEATPGEVPDWLAAAAAGAVAGVAAGAIAGPEGEAETTKEETTSADQLESPGLDDADAAFAWLESLAARQGADEALLLKPEERSDEPPEWVRRAAEEAAAETGGEESEAVAPQAGELEMETSQADGLPEEEEEEEEEAAEPADLPDWMLELQPGDVEEPEEEEAIPAAAAELPDWLQAEDLTSGEDEETPEPAVLPDWIQELQAGQAGEETIPPEAQLQEEETAAQAEPAFGAAVFDLSDAGEGDAETEEELPDWLRQSEPEQTPAGADVFDLTDAGEAEPVSEDELPDWLRQIEPEETPAEAAALNLTAAGEAEPTAEDELPDWLRQAESEEEPAEEEEAGAEDELDWLRQAEPEESLAGAAVFDLADAGEDEADAGDEPPDWLIELEAEAEAARAASLEGEEEPYLGDTKPSRRTLDEAGSSVFESGEPPVSEPAIEAQAETEDQAVAGAESPGLDDADAAFAWLESLAARQGVDEALLLKPEERSDEPPEWVRQAAEEAGMEPSDSEAAVAEEWLAEGPDAIDEAPETEDETLSESPVAVYEAPEAEEETPPEGLFAVYEPTETEAEAQPEGPAAIYEAPETEAETIPESPVEGYEAPETETEDKPVDLPPQDEMDAAFAWLESLAARQGASEALLTKPEERPLSPPEWVDQIPPEPEEPAATEAAAEAEPEETAETPKWLQEAEAEEPAAAQPGPAEPSAEPEIPPLPAWLEEEAAEMEEALLAGSESPEMAATTPEPGELPTVAEEPLAEEAGLPDLPAWLAGEPEAAEPLEWTPPPVPDELVRHFDLNEATLGELERLPNIGFILAQAIIQHRESQGPFRQVEDLLQVPGFTEGTLDAIRERVYVTPPAEPEPDPVWEGLQAAVQAMGEAPEEVQQARAALARGEVEAAVEIYTRLAREPQHLEPVIRDLEQAARQSPGEIQLWQALGDAHQLAGNLQEAIDAYNKALELLQ